MNRMESFNWKSNPFVFEILPELFVGYKSEINKITNGMESRDKFILLLGPTGSGKTTLLRYLMNKIAEKDHILYLPKPPKDPNDWTIILKKVIKRRFSFFSKDDVNLYNLSEFVNKKLKEKKLFILVDECHEASLDSLEWLRTITDQINNLHVLLAGLPIFETLLRDKLETFIRRVSVKIELSNLTKTETRELIKRRIEHNDGDDIKPFTTEAIEFIYEKTGGFPRDILKVCSNLIQTALDKNISTIDIDFLKELETPETRMSLETINELPERQQIIMKILAEFGELTPSEIISRIQIEEYKDRENAVRSVNNLLRRLMNENLIERKRVGKTYKYKVSDKFKTIMIKA